MSDFQQLSQSVLNSNLETQPSFLQNEIVYEQKAPEQIHEETTQEIENEISADQSPVENIPDNNAAAGISDVEADATTKHIITIFDTVMSRLCVVGCNIAGLSATVQEFKLTAQEKKDIEPIAGRLIRKYAATVSDEAALLLLLGGMYLGRVATIATDSTKQKPKPKPGFISTSTGKKPGPGRPRKEPVTITE